MSAVSKNVHLSGNTTLEKDGLSKEEMVFDKAGITNTSKTREKPRRPSQPNEMLTLQFENCMLNFGVILDNKTSNKTSVKSKVALGNVQVSKILPKSPASLDNRLKVGDKLLEVNGRDLTKASLERSR